MPSQNPLDNFINQVIKDAGLGELDPEFEQVYREKMRLSLAKRLGTQALNFLDEENFKTFTELVDSQGDTPNPQAVFDFFTSKVPDFDVKMKEVLEKFRQDYLSAAGAVKTS